MTLRIGLYVPTWPFRGGDVPRWSDIRALALDAERAGVDSLWVADEPGFWECWTTLSAIAEATQRVTIGPLVACTRYRSPALLATMVRALDEVSRGRVILGLGSGSGEQDRRWAAFGWDGARHVSRFGEAVEITARLLRSGPMTFEGEFYQVADPGLGPEGPRPGGPPIWIAARKRRTMAVAAHWGDAVNGVDGLTDRASVERLRSDVEVACSSVGRDPTSITLTGWARLAVSIDGQMGTPRDDTIAGSATAIADRLAEIHEAGIEHLTCFIGDDGDERLFPALTASALARFVPILEALDVIARQP